MEKRMDSRTLGLGIAITYPTDAFSGDEGELMARCRALFERAGKGEPIATEVAELLRRNPRLNEWVAQVLEDPEHRPPHMQPDAVRSYPLVAGDPAPVPSQAFSCPVDADFVWHQRSVADRVPLCPFCCSSLVAT
jgi:hypothetical protein